MVKIYIDGSSPKEKIYPSAYCIFKENKLIYSKVLEKNLPAQDTEYLALIEALNLIKEEIIFEKRINIYTDCGYMIEELSYIRNPKNLKLFKKAIELLEFIKSKFKIRLILIIIPRDKNLAGEYLEKRLIKLRDNEKLVMSTNPKIKKELFRKKNYKKYHKNKKNEI